MIRFSGERAPMPTGAFDDRAGISAQPAFIGHLGRRVVHPLLPAQRLQFSAHRQSERIAGSPQDDPGNSELLLELATTRPTAEAPAKIMPLAYYPHARHWMR
ncbi:MAG: hypothetical protein LH481_17235 [Burkholderiales bacterium]|nr:hypothetical protein [Burkholderiales bacterium]